MAILDNTIGPGNTSPYAQVDYGVSGGPLDPDAVVGRSVNPAVTLRNITKYLRDNPPADDYVSLYLKNVVQKVFGIYFEDENGKFVDTLIAGHRYMWYGVEFKNGKLVAAEKSSFSVSRYRSDDGTIDVERTAARSYGNFYYIPSGKGENYLGIAENTPSGEFVFTSTAVSGCAFNVRVISKDTAYKTVTVSGYRGLGSIVPEMAIVADGDAAGVARFKIKFSGSSLHEAFDEDGSQICTSDFSSADSEQSLVVPVSQTDTDRKIHVESVDGYVEVKEGDNLGFKDANFVAETIGDVLANWYFPVGVHGVADFTINFVVKTPGAVDTAAHSDWRTDFAGNAPYVLLMKDVSAGSLVINKKGGTIANVLNIFEGSTLDSVKLEKVSVVDSELRSCSCKDVNASRCKVSGGDFTMCVLKCCDIDNNSECTGCNILGSEIHDFTKSSLKLCDMRQCYMHDSSVSKINEFGNIEGCLFDRVTGGYVYIRSTSSDIYSYAGGDFKDWWLWAGIAAPEYPAYINDCAILRGSTDYAEYVGRIESTSNTDVVILESKRDGIDEIGVPYYIESEEAKARKEYLSLISPAVQENLCKIWGLERNAVSDRAWISLYWNAVRSARAAIERIADYNSDVEKWRNWSYAAYVTGKDNNKFAAISTVIARNGIDTSSNEALIWELASGRLGEIDAEAAAARSARDEETRRKIREKEKEEREAKWQKWKEQQEHYMQWLKEKREREAREEAEFQDWLKGPTASKIIRNWGGSVRTDVLRDLYKNIQNAGGAAVWDYGPVVTMETHCRGWTYTCTKTGPGRTQSYTSSRPCPDDSVQLSKECTWGTWSEYVDLTDYKHLPSAYTNVDPSKTSSTRGTCTLWDWEEGCNQYENGTACLSCVQWWIASS